MLLTPLLIVRALLLVIAGLCLHPMTRRWLRASWPARVRPRAVR